MLNQAPGVSRYVLSRWLLLRGIALIYLLAFVSLWSQVEGLFGSRGISPIAELVVRLSAREDISFFDAPSIFWWSSSDAALHWICALGVVLSLVAMAGLFAPIAFSLLWFFYLSFVSLGGVFFGYQWDALLLEAGFLAIVTAPWRALSRPSQEAEPPWAVLFLWWILLFKLMFFSGVVKLSSGDKTWRDLTALQYHYVTQPLPSWVAYYVHQLPSWVHTISAFMTFLIELLCPFLIAAPGRARYLAAGCFILLQIMIMLTGSYGFFNLLTCVLCIALLDDFILQKMTPRRWERFTATGEERRVGPRQAALLGGVAAVLFVLHGLQMFGQLWGFERLPRSADRLLEWVQPLRVVNSYGLFAVMTTHRDEIELEGSVDGKTWRAYQFKWKPDLLEEAPSFATPHQPRLDWQMWFAALGRCGRNQWFGQLQQRLLEGSPAVDGLFAKNPFPEGPPLYIRSTVYRYEFTQMGAEAYWRRTKRGAYCPEFMLYEGKLDVVLE